MAVDETTLLNKFDSVSCSQENIQSLSLWLIHHKNHHKKIIETWHNVLVKCESCQLLIFLIQKLDVIHVYYPFLFAASVSHRLTLLYLANDVIQNSKKKGMMLFVEGFEGVLRRCMGLLMDEKIRANVIRVLDIWSERCIYRQSFIEELKSAVPYSETVSNESSATTKIMAEFKMRDVVEAVNRLQSLENETAAKKEDVKGAKLAVLNSEIHLKDKTLGQDKIREADEASRLLHLAITAMEQEQRHRQNLIECLNKALIYTVVQNNEVDQEFKAYVRIGQNAAKVLTTLTAPRSSSSSFPPLPGDVPSPTNSDDGPILPSDPAPGKHTSSLDQRLETILCAIKGPQPEMPANSQPILSAGGYQSAASYDQDSRPGIRSMKSMSNMHIPPPGTSRIAAQPIQSLVSARPGISQPSLQSVHGIGSSIGPGFGPTENCEPADMDITNSDDDEYVPGPRGPNLRVIEPVRSAGDFLVDQRRMPDVPASYLTKSRPGRDNPDNSTWHRMAGERLISPRSQHPPASAPVPNASHRWNPATGRVTKHSDNGRQGVRRSGSFRHH